MRALCVGSLFLFISSFAAGQTAVVSGHSGWNFTDSLQEATDIAVLDVTGGSGIDRTSTVEATASARVVRVLRGDLNPGMTVSLSWSYQPWPNEGPNVTARVEPVHALCFLRTKGDGVFEPLRALATSGVAGAVFMEVPAAAPAGVFAYNADIPFEAKLARETGWTLEQLLLERGSELVADPQGARTRPSREVAMLQVRVSELLLMSRPANPDYWAEIYHEFSQLPEPNLKLIGLTGRLSGGDSEAVFELERSLFSLSSAWVAQRGAPLTVPGPLRLDPATMHALGRIALTEQTLPRSEHTFLIAAQQGRNPEMLAYAAVMLEHPDPAVRGMAMQAFCRIATPQSLRNAEAAAAGRCPDRVPMPDAAQERAWVEYWREWWNQQRPEIAKTHELPVVAVPARYRQADRREMVVAPIEVRFQSFVTWLRPMETHYHSATGEIVNPPANRPTMADALLRQFSEEDRAVLREIAERVNSRLDESQKKMMELRDTFRVRGVPPPQEAILALAQERQETVAKALEEFRSRISEMGYQLFLKQTEGIGRMTGPPRR